MPKSEIDYKFPLVDLRREYEFIGHEISDALRDVMRRGDFILGKEVAEFEKQYAEFCNTKYCIGVGSGTAALFISLISLGIGKGDDVIIPAFTFRASAMAVAMAGARPVLVDVEPDTGNMDVDLLEESLTPRTRAIMPVHLYGHVADMDRIMEFAQKHGIYVIEDACEAEGSLYKGRKAGSMGIASAFSFYPSKNLGCYADGGAIVTNDEKVAEKACNIRKYGNGGVMGINSRLSTFQGAVLKVKFKFLEEWNRKRREIAEKYKEMLEGLPIEFPPQKDYAYHTYYLYVIRLKERDELLKYLNERGIEARIHFEPPIHLLDGFNNDSYKVGDFPRAEKLAKEVLSIPMHQYLTDEDISEICREIRSFYKK